MLFRPRLTTVGERDTFLFVDDEPQIPTAPVADLDLDQESDEDEWERRVMGLATSSRSSWSSRVA